MCNSITASSHPGITTDVVYPFNVARNCLHRSHEASSGGSKHALLVFQLIDCIDKNARDSWELPFVDGLWLMSHLRGPLSV